MGEVPRDPEHFQKVERAYRKTTDALWELAQKFEPDSEEVQKVRQAELENWDLAKRKTLYSELAAKRLSRNKNSRK